MENAQSCPMKDFHVTVNDTMLKKTSISISAIFIGHFFLFTSFYDLYILPYLRGNLKLRNDHYFQIWIYLETYDQVIFKMAFSNQADLLHWSVGINFIQSFFFSCAYCKYSLLKIYFTWQNSIFYDDHSKIVHICAIT